MTYLIKILRKERDKEERYRQSFFYETDNDSDTVAAALTSLNERKVLTDINGQPARKIEWECSCLQKKCGACAMVINGRPKLACEAKLSEYSSGMVNLAPLSKFPTVCDLICDRSILFGNLKNLRAWLDTDAQLSDLYHDIAYESSECLQCGCCLEICPNFYAGGKFYGMSALPVTMRLLTEKQEYKELSKLYSKHIFGGCGRSLACKAICPKGIDTEKMLVNANLLAVWKRKKR